VLVGLHRVGFVGLRDTLEGAAGSGLEAHDQLVDLILQELASSNYIPDPKSPDLRSALWREYLRHEGEDFSGFFSEVEVTVRCEAGEERDRFVDLGRAALAEMELQPVVRYQSAESSVPELVIRGEVVARGMQSQRRLHGVLRRTLSDW
jgi:hypothetical protein